MPNVALFPIPDSVNFPGVPCSLHVFEPRYRQMVRHCIDQNLLMGVCHTEKVLHRKDREQTIEEALNSNQTTYKPQGIFSAGAVELLEELEDGRMLIQVDNTIRLKLGEEKTDAAIWHMGLRGTFRRGARRNWRTRIATKSIKNLTANAGSNPRQ